MLTTSKWLFQSMLAVHLLVAPMAGQALASDTPAEASPPDGNKEPQKPAPPPFVASNVTVRLTQVTVRRTGALWGKADLYVVAEAFADDVAQPQLVFKMPATDDDQVLPLGMSGHGVNLYSYDKQATPSLAPPHNVRLRVRVFKSEEALRKAAESLVQAASVLGKSVPLLSAVGPAAVISASVTALGATGVANVLASVGTDHESYEWVADLAANDANELGAQGAQNWSSDNYGKTNIGGRDKQVPPAVRLDGGLRVN
jgi:hypothetical protein